MSQNNHDKPNQNPANESPASDPESANTTADVRLEDFTSAVPVGSENVEHEAASKDDAAGTPKGNGGLSAPNPKKPGIKNSLLHGVYSCEIILPWEREEEFKKLHDAFRTEWMPSGYSEEQAVFDVTYYTWLKLRSIKSANLRFFKCSMPDEVRAGEDTWEEMIEWQKKVPKYGTAAVAEARTFMNKLDATFEHVRSHHYWTKDSEGKDVQAKLLYLQRDITSLIEEARTKVIAGVERLVAGMAQATTYYDQAYQPEEIDNQVNLMAKLDARIEKAIRRLTAIKVFKRVDGVEAPTPRLVSPSVVLGNNASSDQRKR